MDQQAHYCQHDDCQTDEAPPVAAGQDDDARDVVQTLIVKFADPHQKRNDLAFALFQGGFGLDQGVLTDIAHDGETQGSIDVGPGDDDLYLCQDEDNEPGGGVRGTIRRQ